MGLAYFASPVLLFSFGHLEDLPEIGLLLAVVVFVVVVEETRQRVRGRFFELGHVDVEFLDVGMLCRIGLDDHPQHVNQEMDSFCSRVSLPPTRPSSQGWQNIPFFKRWSGSMCRTLSSLVGPQRLGHQSGALSSPAV